MSPCDLVKHLLPPYLGPDIRRISMPSASVFARVLASLMAAMTALWCGPAAAQTLDRVSFGTNWVAEAEHGGVYQALADGTYRQDGLDVTILPGRPQINNRIPPAVRQLHLLTI